MFCIQCGTQLGEGKKFCKNCGASTAKREFAPVPETISTPAVIPPEKAPITISQSHTLPISLAHHSRVINKVVIAAAGVAVLVAAGAGVYFGTDLFRRQSVPESSTGTPQTMAKIAEQPAALPVEAPEIEAPGSGELRADSDFTSPLWSKLAEAPFLTAIEPQTATSETRPKPAPEPDPTTLARKAQSRSTAQDSRARERVSGPQATVVRPPANPGTYQTIRPTRVFESPSPTSRVVARIDDGIRVNVVGSTGDWLEVRSRTGNPPGFIRRDDAVQVE